MRPEVLFPPSRFDPSSQGHLSVVFAGSSFAGRYLPLSSKPFWFITRKSPSPSVDLKCPVEGLAMKTRLNDFSENTSNSSQVTIYENTCFLHPPV